MALSKAEWEEWRRHPVTQEVYKVLKTSRQEWVDRTTDLGNSGDLFTYGQKTGIIYGIDLLLEMEVED